MKRAAKKILDSHSILVVSHKRPDGDSIGSQLGLISGLKKMEKKVLCLNEDPVPEMFSFLRNSRSIKNTSVIKFSPDLIICLDISNLERTGERIFSFLKDSHSFKLNIDHHVSNEYFGDMNIVDTNASSTSELVYDLLVNLDVDISRDIAEPLLAGIVTDTGSFRFSNVTAKTLRCAAYLLEKKADISRISTEVYMSKPLSKVRLSSKVLERMEIIADKSFSYLLSDDFKSYNAKMEYTEGLVNEILNIQGINFAVLLTEESKNFCRLSFRSKDKKYDANKFAEKFDGGGHKFAAGGRLKEKAEIALKKLKRELINL
ncbi:MAG: bifunctional oligoribonuclease/PAP phosphatase NrnA [bacterium]